LSYGSGNDLVMLPDGAGGAILVIPSNSGADDVYAQRLNSNGNALWGTNGVSVCNAPGRQGNAQAVADGVGGVFITWGDDRLGLDAPDIYAQRLDANGAPLWAVNGVAISTAVGSQNAPYAVLGPSGSAIVGWVDSRKTNRNDYDIFVQAIRGDGQLGGTVTDTPRAVLQQRLEVNFSNPCRSRVDFSYTLPLSSNVTLRLFDASGRERMMESLGNRPSGTYPNSWDLRGLPAGIYVLRAEASGSSVARKLVIVR
jgi:hypothetical protein